MKRKIEAFEYANEILQAIPKGVLMTTQADGQVDTMTIGWGTMGVQWGKPIFIAYVRESRHTKTLVDKNPEFTINVPYGAYDKSILGFCGTKSGRDTDKIKELGLHLEEGETVAVPAIRELPLTLECKVIYKQEQVKEAIAPDALERYYPEGDFHTAYYGQITAAYIVE
ncbi:MAG: flavin reductase family protein [Oscillospiraceae bacterium]|nr:flavin reductase family protein [Oscillospiraceae bacterium]